MAELRAVLSAGPTGRETYLETIHGKPITAKGFGNHFRRWADAAGLPHCTAHGLRKAGACIAAENGATVNELMALFGWKNAAEAQIYTRMADQKRLAASAAAKLIAVQR